MADAFFLHFHHSVHMFAFCILHFLIVCDFLLSVLVALMSFWKKMKNTITFSSILTADITQITYTTMSSPK